MSDRPSVPGVTVDAAKARELDDAIWVERTAAGYRLTVAIADVASLVPIGSIDDELAAARGLTVYVGHSPKAAMFNTQIAQGLASLLPGRERPVMAYTIDYDEEGGVVAQGAARALLKSGAKLAYENFDEMFYHGEGALCGMVRAAVPLASTLWRNRVAVTGLPDWEAAFDAAGVLREDAPFGMLAQTVVHEFMVAANSAATDLVRAHGAPMIYRNQGARAGGPTGRYEIVNHGHAALGRVAYGQFTSPIRRYTDLINQRIQCAVMAAEAPPYDVAQLTYICAASNRATQRAEVLSRAKAEAFHQPSPHHTAHPSGPPLDRLDAVGFRRVLEQAGGFDHRTTREFARRVVDGLLTHSDVAWLLFATDSVADDALRVDLLHRLTGNPEEMARIWECAFNEQALPMFEAQVQSHAGRWIAAAAVGKCVGDGDDPDPVRARGLAVVRLAADVVGVRLPDGAPPEGGLRLADTLSKAKLVALCRLLGWQGPDYSVEAQGVGARHHFRATVAVRVEGFDYQSPTVHASTRKSAEAAAAALALTALEPYADDIMGREVAAYGVDLTMLRDQEAQTRPLSALLDFCRRHRAAQRFVWLMERPSICRFECALEVSAAGTTLRVEGVAETRTAAMEAAAREAIAAIVGKGERSVAATAPQEA